MPNTKPIATNATHSPTQWYVYLCGESVGPLSISTLTRMLKEHRLSFSDFVWTETLEGWRQIQDLEPFADLLPLPPGVPVPTRKELRSLSRSSPSPLPKRNLDLVLHLPDSESYSVREITGRMLHFRSDKSLLIDREIPFRVTAQSIEKPLEMTGLLLKGEEENTFTIEFTRINPSHLRIIRSLLKEEK